MKRTGEIVLGVIGAVMYALSAGLGWFMLWMGENGDMLRETIESDPELQLGAGEFDAALDFMGAGGTFLIAVSLLAVVLGIVAMFLLKGNKNPKLAGIIFLIVSVGVAVVTFGAAIFPGIFYLVAGIMCLARKPKEPLEL